MQSAYNSVLVIFEVDIENPAAPRDLVSGYMEQQPTLAGLWLPDDRVLLAGVQQSHTIRPMAYGCLDMLKGAVEYCSEINGGPGVDILFLIGHFELQTFDTD